MFLYQHILLLLTNLAAYSLSFFFIIRNRNESVISVRSPTLLILNNLGGLLMTSIYICYEMMNDLEPGIENFELFCKVFPNNYMVCHFLMMISFILRCQRIIQCCKINYDERVEIKEFYDKRYLFTEKFYIKVLFGLMTVILFINFLLNLQFADSDLNLIPYNFTNCMKDPKRARSFVSLIWIVINFLEDMTLVTYTYLILVNHIKQMIKVELFLFVIVWMLYPNVLRYLEIILNSSSYTSYICLFFLWLCLLINGYLPVIFSYFDRNSISYHFNPKLTNNIYLFLSDEICFYSFYDFVSEKGEQDLFYFDLYTCIIKYKLKYTIEPDYYKVLDDGKEIYEKYFSCNGNDSVINIEIMNKVKYNCQILNKEECNYDMFDDALILAYEYLENVFIKYKRSDEYKILIDNLNLNSYIQCKMCNTGLISRY